MYTKEKNIHDLWIVDDFLDMTLKLQSMKKRNDKLDFTKIKKNSALKDTAKRMKDKSHNKRKYL